MTTRVRNLVFRDPSSTAEKTQRTLFRSRETVEEEEGNNDTPSPKTKKVTRSEIRARVERERKERLVKRMRSYGIVSPSVSTTKKQTGSPAEDDDDDVTDRRYAETRARLVDVRTYQSYPDT